MVFQHFCTWPINTDALHNDLKNFLERKASLKTIPDTNLQNWTNSHMISKSRGSHPAFHHRSPLESCSFITFLAGKAWRLPGYPIHFHSKNQLISWLYCPISTGHKTKKNQISHVRPSWSSDAWTGGCSWRRRCHPSSSSQCADELGQVTRSRVLAGCGYGRGARTDELSFSHVLWIVSFKNARKHT